MHYYFTNICGNAANAIIFICKDCVQLFENNKNNNIISALESNHFFVIVLDALERCVPELMHRMRLETRDNITFIVNANRDTQLFVKRFKDNIGCVVYIDSQDSFQSNIGIPVLNISGRKINDGVIVNFVKAQHTKFKQTILSLL